MPCCSLEAFSQSGVWKKCWNQSTFLKEGEKYKIKYQSEYEIKARIEIRTDSNLEIIDKHEDIITSREKKNFITLPLSLCIKYTLFSSFFFFYNSLPFFICQQF